MTSLPSFEEILNRNQAMVYSVFWNALRNRAVAEELMQEVFLGLHQNFAQLESAEHARNWLRRTAANRAIDELRRLRYRRGPSLEEVAEPSEEAVEADPLLGAELRRQLERLPPEARVLTILRYQEDMQPLEIAERLQLPVNTVKSRLHRALKLLRGRLEAHTKVVKRTK
ncbi:sigma-70 family RNA polymerase sigma factor [Nostoc sp. NIES-2111]